MNRLVSCPSCRRHVRLSDALCPFCGDDVSAVSPPPAPQTFARLGRAAIFAFGASVGVAACGSDAPLYGAPPVDAAVVDAGPDDGGIGGFDAAYGAPPFDAGEADADAGSGPAPAYGAAPAD